MTPRAGTPLRWLRALLLATVALVAGAVAHVAADGSLPPAPAMALLLLAGTATVAPLLHREASTRRVVVLLVLGQAAVHTVLTALSGHREPGAAAEHEHLHGPALWAHHLAEDLTPEHAVMALAHAAAAAVVGLWLAWGERTLWALLALAGRRVLPVRRPVLLPVVGRPRVVPVDGWLLPPPRRCDTSPLVGRAPPRVAAE